MKVVVLTGGGGGARLIDGLRSHLAPGQLTCVVNTGDDFEHLGLTVCPDLDTIVYTLGGVLDDRGWGRAGDSFRCLDQLAALGGEAWFRLGDLDLAVHLQRTQLLAGGARLTEATAAIARGFDVAYEVLPMSDHACSTELELHDGTTVPFQRWYVGARAAPAVRRVHYAGGPAPVTHEVADAIEAADAIVLAPSNPYLSLGPILALPEIPALLAKKRVVAVSPLVGGAAVTGPLARLIGELGAGEARVATVVAHYGALVSAWLVDPADAGEVEGARAIPTDVVMHDRAGRIRLAATVLEAVA